MSLPRPSERYDQRWASEQTRQLEQQWAMTHRRGTDIEMGQDERLILRSPDGARWSITVSNAGVLAATAL